MSTEKSSYRPFDTIRIPEFKLYILQRFFFVMAVRMMGAVALFKMASLTNDPLQGSFLALAEAVPAVSLALYSGHIIDRSDKRTMLFRTILLYCGCAGGFLLVTLPAVESSIGKGFVQYGMYVFMFFTGVIRAFSGPTSASILAQLVPRNILPNAVTWSSSTWLTASVIGHGSAGFLIVYAGYTGAFMVAMASLIISASCMFRIERKPVMHSNMEQKTWESVKEALKYVLRTKDLLAALSLDMFAVLFGGVAQYLLL